MKSSVILATSYAILAMAGPAVNKRAMETLTNWVDVTITVTDDGPKPTKMFAPGAPKSHTKSSTSTPPPAPTTTSSPPPPPASTPPASTPAADPAPVQSQAPAAQVSVAVQSSGDDYQSQAIYHHNVHRANHSASSVGWDDSDAGYAAEIAGSCNFAHDMTKGGGGYGQNLAMYASSDGSYSKPQAIAAAISDMWYTEMPNFPASDYGQATPDMSNFESWGHWSQMIWKGSTSIGCATVECDNMVPGMKAWFTVCNYRPAGNVGGAYGANVAPPENQPSVS